MTKKILLGIPTYKSICSEGFAYQMGMLLDGVNSGLVKHIEMECNMYVTMARNKMCRSAIDLWKKGEITHLLMVDDDVMIPAGGIASLASRDFPVVGGAYYRRDLVPCVYNFDPFVFCDSIPGLGLFSADGTGGGCLLVECELLNRMAEEFGDEWWFNNTIENSKSNAQGTYLGEDVFFFKRLKRMGLRVVIDCDVQCGHIGTSIADRALYEIKNGIRKFEPKQNV